MDLQEALRTTGAVRDFGPDPVPPAIVRALLDDARFAPNGGNRQPWRVVDIRSGEIRRAMRDLYVEGWVEYLALRRAGLIPFAVTNCPAEERRLLTCGPTLRPGAFAEGLHTVPALLAIFADLSAVAAVDKDLDRYTLAGGASIYPFVHNILLAARARGLAGVLTTVHQRRERAVRRLLGAPPHFALAAVVALGSPAAPAVRVRRAPVDDFATTDRIDGPPLPET